MNARGLIFAFACSLALAGCTTISATPNASNVADIQQESPIVEMANALVQRFTLRGWSTKPDRVRQMNRLAGILTRGLGKANPEPKQDPVDIYVTALQEKQAGQNLESALLVEVNLASTETLDLSQQVEKNAVTNSSAEVLRQEMLALEQAVLSAKKARKLFVTVARRKGLKSTSVRLAIRGLNAQIEDLTRQTDAINQRRQNVNVG
jgi:hypothetical protein